MSSSTCHISVLLNETVDALLVREQGRYLDCTFGGGGHTSEILRRNGSATVVAFDRDARALERAVANGIDTARVTLRHAPFSEVATHLTNEKFDGILADLGLSSDQLAEGRGFSFNDEGKLDMRMDESSGETAADLLGMLSERDIARMLSRGGVKLSARYARAIKKSNPRTPAELSNCILEATPAAVRYEKDTHPATVVFQAIRIAVNREYEEIEALLEGMPKVAAPGCRVAVICFHSGEDKIVAERFRRWSRGDSTPPSWRGPREKSDKPLGKLLGKDAIRASEEELQANPRARSARLRVFEFFGETVCQ